MAKSREALVIIMFFFGAIFTLSGLVFTLQGYGIVGPTSSFMYQSQTWIYQGITILALGLLVLALAFFFRRRTSPSVIPVVDGSPIDQKRNSPNA
jgi:MYXO-CTERM domain-containing protein